MTIAYGARRRRNRDPPGPDAGSGGEVSVPATCRSAGPNGRASGQVHRTLDNKRIRIGGRVAVTEVRSAGEKEPRWATSPTALTGATGVTALDV